VFLTLFGLYEPIVNFAGAGATVPLSGFGYSLCKGVMKAVNDEGLIGIIKGGVMSTAAGITAAIVFGYIIALIFKPKQK
ncbi:MAG: SpoVA/SpoVAEb family sporulation membrane protein, partial [Clostridiaceae bacterium]|nr:SpoVA/SpoVAEb family sporulation membrane protein [Clostridiaceae bacterium]